MSRCELGGNDVRVIKLMSKVGALLGEDKIRGQLGGRQKSSMFLFW
jgi:hypothetical protein